MDEVLRVLVPERRRGFVTDRTRTRKTVKPCPPTSTSGRTTCTARTTTPWPGTAAWTFRVRSSGWRTALGPQPRGTRQHERRGHGAGPHLLHRGRGAARLDPVPGRLETRRARRLQRHAALETAHRVVGRSSAPFPLRPGAPAAPAGGGRRPGLRDAEPGGPVVALDAATGQTVREYNGTERTEEIIADNGILYLAVGTSEAEPTGGGLFTRGEPAPTGFRFITAIDAATAKAVVEEGLSTKDEYLLPLTLAVKGSRLYYQSSFGVVCLDARSGKEIWKTARPTPARRMALLRADAGGHRRGDSAGRHRVGKAAETSRPPARSRGASTAGTSRGFRARARARCGPTPRRTARSCGRRRATKATTRRSICSSSTASSGSAPSSKGWT